MKTRASVLAVAGFCALALPASAQIITTSIPRADSGAAGASGEKRWAVHVMATPLANWEVKDFFFTDIGDVLFDGPIGIPVAFSGESDGFSNILLAGEASFRVGDNGAVGFGGWYNSLGELDTTYNAILTREAALALGESPGKQELGTQPQDLGSFTEVHGNAFWKDFGVQGGLVFLSKEFVTGESRTDWDAYAVYRKSFHRAGSVSLGGGVYTSGATSLGGVEVAERFSRFSGFITASVPVYKGLTVDGSFWYIGKSSVANDADIPDDMSRYLVGVGYTF